MKRGAGTVPGGLKLPKADVGYHPPLPTGMRPHHGQGVRCGICRFSYRPRGSETWRCLIVEGLIHVHGWCPLWNRDGTLDLDYFSGREIGLMLRPLMPFLRRIFK